uniref:Putative ovule protein n=1 Tax=Solanum chacoense TaxID=4108 RepID=A0A0V0GUS3_SOLCH
MRFSKMSTSSRKTVRKISVSSKEQQQQSFFQILRNLVPNMFTNPLAYFVSHSIPLPFPITP